MIAMPMNVVQPENMILFVQHKMGARSRKEFAEALGCSELEVSRVLRGERFPSKAMLKRLGLKVVYQIVE
jgi:transcriptional regulator with XRE-family HTH domain